jgi:hypothetical protein
VASTVVTRREKDMTVEGFCGMHPVISKVSKGDREQLRQLTSPMNYE